MTNHASQQPRNEQESYQPLWDDSPARSELHEHLPGEQRGSVRSFPAASLGGHSVAGRREYAGAGAGSLLSHPHPQGDAYADLWHARPLSPADAHSGYSGNPPRPRECHGGPRCYYQPAATGRNGRLYSRNGCAVPWRRPHHLGNNPRCMALLAIVVFCNPLIDALIIYPFDNQAAGSLFFWGHPGAGHLRYSGDSLVRLLDYGHQQGVQEILRGKGAALERRESYRVLVLPRVYRLTPQTVNPAYREVFIRHLTEVNAPFTLR